MCFVDDLFPGEARFLRGQRFNDFQVSFRGTEQSRVKVVELIPQWAFGLEEHRIDIGEV